MNNLVLHIHWLNVLHYCVFTILFFIHLIVSFLCFLTEMSSPVYKIYLKIFVYKAKSCQWWTRNASYFLGIHAKILWHWRILTTRSRHKLPTKPKARFENLYFLEVLSSSMNIPTKYVSNYNMKQHGQSQCCRFIYTPNFCSLCSCHPSSTSCSSSKS